MLFLHNHKRATLIKIFAIATILPIATFAFGKILTINSVSAVTHEIPEGYTTIVDPIFYDCVVKEFISEFPNESIAATGPTDQQLAQISALYCGDFRRTEKITDSTGLEKMTSLTYLDLNYDDLSEIDVTKNTDLEHLNLSGNDLSEIDVTKNTDLEYLNLSSNNLSEIDVTKNTNLAGLDLDNNNLSEIDVTKNTNLTRLKLDHNDLSEIDVTKNTDLEYLNLNSNNLSEIDVTKNTNLTSLRLADNSIFDFSSAENLTLDQYSSLGRQSQTIETESTTYVLPPLFTQVKTEGWGAGFANPMYTDQPFILTNATLSADGKSTTIINPDEPATIEIDGGMADGSILTINYTGPQERTYTLSFNANGGTNAPAALTYGPTTASSHTFTIPTGEPTYSGHTFLGWADTANATTANQDYASGHAITISANKTLYAVWQVEEPEPEPESTVQVPDTGLITGDGQNGVNDYNTATFIPLLVIMLTSIHIILKIKAKILSKTH